MEANEVKTDKWHWVEYADGTALVQLGEHVDWFWCISVPAASHAVDILEGYRSLNCDLLAALKALVSQLRCEDDLEGPDLITCSLCGGINGHDEEDCEVGIAEKAIEKAEGQR